LLFFWSKPFGPLNLSLFQIAAKVSELGVDDILPVEVDGIAMILYRNGDSVRSCERYCPHQRADLSEGMVSRGHLICASHGWSFDADNGVHEKSKQTCVTMYEVRIVGENILVKADPIRNAEAPHT
jgi:nitrite reductase/ring-hydroxylating ferredoxin subunit